LQLLQEAAAATLKSNQIKSNQIKSSQIVSQEDFPYGKAALRVSLREPLEERGKERK
jgi:hypothetical protein